MKGFRKSVIDSQNGEKFREFFGLSLKDRNRYRLKIFHPGMKQKIFLKNLIMLGFNIPAKGKEKRYIEKMEALLEKLPDTLLVNCPFDFEQFD